MSSPISRRIATALAVCMAIACAIAMHTSAASAAPFARGPLVPYIVGGQETSVDQFPWQVFVLVVAEEGPTTTEASCGGSILDATHILTAAHCVDHEGTTTRYPAEDIGVLAGASDVSGFTSSLRAPHGSQLVTVSSVRTHPYYTLLPEIKDDVAVLTLSEPLELSAEKNTASIPLVPSGATPTPGTALTVSGYGKENGAEGAEPDGKLFSATLTAIGSDPCRESVGVNSAVLLCASGSSSATCQGDSGGPLTEGSPAIEVGVVDFGPASCPTGQVDGFTNLAAPEVREFVEGSETPQVAGRPSSPPAIKTLGTAPVDYSPLTCESGSWSGSPTIAYTFEVENGSAQVLQSGPSNVLMPSPSLVGDPLVCIVQASNPGGVSTDRSATTPAITTDAAPPVASITGVKCRLQACALSLSASDPNGVALAVTASVSYQVTAKCPVKNGRRKRKGKQPVCHRSATVSLPVSPVSPGVFSAFASGLPYGERIAFDVAVVNAAGLRQVSVPTGSTVLRKPKPKPRKHTKPEKKKQRKRR
ncbi:MAG TPA: serine protease [Solirubrobacteraceae bacterium]|jgi:secreted trypsin-like serine protease